MKKRHLFFAGIAATLGLSACTNGSEQSGLLSGLDPTAFDTIINEKPVKLYTLKNKNGMEVSITNYGGRVVSLVVPDKTENQQMWY